MPDKAVQFESKRTWRQRNEDDAGNDNEHRIEIERESELGSFICIEYNLH